ncbi:MAG TPA: NAD(P)H-dependent glycerol-3-phosphate dehydrogenase [Myxococcota bacterium]|nr:NAD(P)H-dependent glycerol-3-phosphate dehydrogenase [Myxococcota bacterium]HRY94206.1 NAD(P)H-dependent glycerol-3-phosphate dehydrogenase [Myxococcota bacterium]HSA20108.1 NAD(P)H-dependent glycerol-3-phosphate dehydrogenase [Myxococcota bacterium]
MRVGVIGAGAWGTALAQLLASKGDEVRLWAYEPEVAEDIRQRHENRVYLAGIELHPALGCTTSLGEAVDGAGLVLSVMPSHVVREIMGRLAPLLPVGVPLVSATKGIENDSLMTVGEVLEDVLPIVYHPMLAFLSGPSFAREVALLRPTAVSVAARYERVAVAVQQQVAGPTFRAYTTTDVVGVELGGALKNVIAIAAGAADGLGLGHNAVAALITRGLAEVTRLAVKRGANPLTLSGLSGMGDLVLTCTGALSRNRQVGQKLAQGLRREDIVRDMRQVAEGILTARAAHRLATREEIDMPICAHVYRMLYEDLPVQEAVIGLMGRSLKKEIYA